MYFFLIAGLDVNCVIFMYIPKMKIKHRYL